MINRFKEKISVILNFDKEAHPKLSQTTMTFEEHSQLIQEVFEEDIPSLIEKFEELKKALEWYADEKVYEDNNQNGYEPILDDKGNLARQFLISNQ